ncbi:MAG: glycosyltransferase family 4 protein [Methylomonas sp.]|jgi:glycosyltransferase involved in cell wall biosynthesis
MNNKIKVLVIAEAANPAWVSVPLIGWSLADALREVADTHLVTQIRNRSDILDAGLKEGVDFTVLDSEKLAAPLWKIGEFLRGGQGKGWTTLAAVSVFSYYYFEYLLWRQFGKAIRAGEYDIVHRITPLSPTTPSLLAKKCRKAGVPFILGPLNGGVPWPRAFDSARRKEKEWLSYVRSAYKLLPGYRSTLACSSALLIGSKYTLSQIPERFRSKCIYLPENAIDPSRFSKTALPAGQGKLRACFVGRFVEYKGPDMLLEAAAPLLKKGVLHIDYIGDGPLMPAIKKIIEREGLEHAVTLHGWVAHKDIQSVMCQSQVLAFPSIREFGGGVVLEAMALGIAPLVVDYAGPGELVNDEVGFKIPIGDREAIINGFRQKLEFIIANPGILALKAGKAQDYVKQEFTWSAKARKILEIYRGLVKS